MGRQSLRGLGAALLLAGLACAPDSGVPDDPQEGRGGPGFESSSDTPSAPGPPIVLVDALGDTLRLETPATRILSLVPAATEILLRLDAASLLVGRTDYDTSPALAELPSVGGGLGPNLEVVRTLEPQVVLTFGGESDPRTREALRAFDVAPFEVRPERMADVPVMIRELGVIAGRREQGEALARRIQADLDLVRTAVEDRAPLRAIYLLGGSPPWAAGAETFLSDLITLAGGVNVLDDLDVRYGPVSPEVLRDRPVDVILVNQGTPVDPRIARGRRVEVLPAWVEIPGADLADAAWAVARALHPDLREDD